MDRDPVAPEAQHFLEMCFLEIELPGNFVVLLIERTARDKNSDSHEISIVQV
jgi:hypothetical protein